MNRINALVVCLWLAASKAQGEEQNSAVVIPHGGALEIDELAAFAREVTAELQRDGYALPIVPAKVFEGVHSRLATSVELADLARLGRELKAARRARRTPLVMELTESVMHLLDEAPDTALDQQLGDDEEVATVLSDACTEGLIAFKAAKAWDLADPVVRRCASLAWLVSRNERIPAVLAPIVSQEAATYELTVRVMPSGRPMRLQGARLEEGTTSIRTLPGTRLPITVDCGRTKRTHWIVAKPGETQLVLEVGCDFDAALHTDSRGLWLSSAPEELQRHVRQTIAALGVQRAIIVERSGDRYVLRRIEPDERGGASVAVSVLHSGADVATALDDLRAGHVAQHQREERGPRGSGLSSPNASHARAQKLLRAVGGISLGVGLALNVVGWTLFRSRSEKGETLRSSLPGTASEEPWVNQRKQIIAMAVTSAAIGAAGVVLLVQQAEPARVPWWVVALGGAGGVALATWGVVDVVKGGRCGRVHQQACELDEQRRDRGTMLLSTSIPLLALPIAKAAARKNGRSISVSLHGPSLVGFW